MSQANLAAELERLRIQLQAFAAIGAALHLRQEGVSGDPRVTALVNEVTEAVRPSLLDGIAEAEARAALANIRRLFVEGVDLLDHPERPSGWAYDDREVLRAVGNMSASTVNHITSVAATRPGLAAIINGDGTFLDISTGVAGIAIEAAKTWKSMRVVGLEIWPPSLAIARDNIAASGLSERIELRDQNVLDIQDRGAFSLIWLPTPFIPGEVVTAALPTLLRALSPGGYLVFNTGALPADPLSAALSRLRIARTGGQAWIANEIAGRLRELGFDEVEVVAPIGHTQFILGRRTDTAG
jgi:SAM-dependent methyltransferase